ncbi:uncharacterized protein FRV6_13857 [Fusarium oxysporum]|uniref:Uncharacterized protein n=1 Tax=Fusarium oxysporum TaxID=5507 RepID=A0A2H3U6Q1_FUSOX|nr:uncharacterized protein FRV6_13857 [Fusarium oxysporum]
MDWCVFRPWNYINGPAYDGADIADEGLPPSHLLKPSYGLKPAWKDSVEERSAPEPAPVAPTTKKYWERELQWKKEDRIYIKILRPTTQEVVLRGGSGHARFRPPRLLLVFQNTADMVS